MYAVLGFTQSHSRVLRDIEGFIQKIPGTYNGEKPNNFTGSHKIHLKCDCINGSIENGVQQPILFSFALDKPLGHKIYKEPKIKLFKKINKAVLLHITFYSEDDDTKPVDFFNGTIISTCQLAKI